MKNDKLISLRLPLELYELVRELAESVDRPTTWVIRKALEEYLKRAAGEEAYREGA